MSALPPPTDHDLLDAFITHLETLETAVNKANIEVRSLQQDFLTTQQLYQQQLLPTLMASPNVASLISYQTEINRALRLLGMDVSFLQTAKHPMTVQKRQAHMRQRVQTLLEFSHGLKAQLE
ncbi:MAG: heterocyst frequency control protein PatD [Cyanobacteria bacterium J06639_14]